MVIKNCTCWFANVKERSYIMQDALISKVAGQNLSIHIEYSVLQDPPITEAVIWALSHTNP
jgi:hypothetical protein